MYCHNYKLILISIYNKEYNLIFKNMDECKNPVELNSD